MAKPKTPTYIYGFHPVREVLRAKKRPANVIYTTKPPSQAFKNLKKLLPSYTQIQHVSRSVLNKLSEHNEHQGVVLATTPFAYTTKPFTPHKHRHILMLDSIQDPRNVGAILRSAYCTNITAVVVPRKHTASITAVALKASAGLAEHLTIYQPASSTQALQEIKQAGYTPYMAAMDGTPAHQCSFDQPSCLVIGNEATGISKELLQKGKHITLPQKQSDISYNASVAAGILLFILATQTQRI